MKMRFLLRSVVLGNNSGKYSGTLSSKIRLEVTPSKYREDILNLTYGLKLIGARFPQ